jgi:hypothetical protein
LRLAFEIGATWGQAIRKPQLFERRGGLELPRRRLVEGRAGAQRGAVRRLQADDVAGASLTTTAPTGSYDPDTLLGLGADRWSFKPEFALRCPFVSERRWPFDGYANIYFFTDNTAYHGREILRQEPLFGVEGHVSYSFNDSVWVSLDTRYAFRGGTDDSQRNFLLGTEMTAAITPRNSLIYAFAKALVHENAPAATGFGVRYQYLWGNAYR